jgi:hypothetical protein
MLLDENELLINQNNEYGSSYTITMESKGVCQVQPIYFPPFFLCPKAICSIVAQDIGLCCGFVGVCNDEGAIIMKGSCLQNQKQTEAMYQTPSSILETNKVGFDTVGTYRPLGILTMIKST